LLGGEEVALITYTHISKCKNNKIKGENRKNAVEEYILKL
jgi:hypothetical protein